MQICYIECVDDTQQAIGHVQVSTTQQHKSPSINIIYLYCLAVKFYNLKG